MVCFFYHHITNYLQNYVQTISNLLKEEHRDKWEEVQLVRDKRVFECGEGLIVSVFRS